MRGKPAETLDEDLFARDIYCVLGVPIDKISMQEVVKKLAHTRQTRRRMFLSTPNLNFLALCHRSSEFKRSLWKSDLCVADGISIVMLARLLGVPLDHRVSGADLIETLQCSNNFSQSQPLRVFLFGGTENTADLACKAVNKDKRHKVRCLSSIYPGFGSVTEMSKSDYLLAINEAEPDFLIVALGAEKGQAWILRNLGKLKVPIISHLGATINFLAGSIDRAPEKWQRLGLEWLWRIKEEPHLFRRYASDGSYLMYRIITTALPLAIWLACNRRCRHNQLLKSSWQANSLTDEVELVLEGVADDNTYEELIGLFTLCIQENMSIKIDLRNLKWIDLKSLGAFISLWNEMNKRNKKLQLIRPDIFMKFYLKNFGFSEILS